MSFLGKLFGKKSPAPSAIPAAPASADPSKDPNMIKVFDAYGREMFITKQAWRDSVLLDHLKKVWNDADQLYTTIVQSLQDGFGADMIKPAERLAALDQNAERGAVVLAIVYREQKRLGDSEKVLRRHIERHGESGVVLTKLAKVHSDRGQPEESLRTLWRGLELDPNQENGLGWYAVIFREKDGDDGFLAALRRIAALPHSWRARLWLARDALTRQQLNEALALYGEALALTPRPVPTDFLQQLSGDLGNHGHGKRGRVSRLPSQARADDCRASRYFGRRFERAANSARTHRRTNTNRDRVERRLSVVEELETVVNANLQRATRLRQSILQRAFSSE